MEGGSYYQSIWNNILKMDEKRMEDFGYEKVTLGNGSKYIKFMKELGELEYPLVINDYDELHEVASKAYQGRNDVRKRNNIFYYTSGILVINESLMHYTENGVKVADYLKEIGVKLIKPFNGDHIQTPVGFFRRMYDHSYPKGAGKMYFEKVKREPIYRFVSTIEEETYNSEKVADNDF